MATIPEYYERGPEYYGGAREERIGLPQAQDFAHDSHDFAHDEQVQRPESDYGDILPVDHQRPEEHRERPEDDERRPDDDMQESGRYERRSKDYERGFEQYAREAADSDTGPEDFEKGAQYFSGDTTLAPHSRDGEMDLEKAFVGQGTVPTMPLTGLVPNRFTHIEPRIPSSDEKEKKDEKDEKDKIDIYAHLPDDEKEILKRQIDLPDVKVGYFSLYRYATKMDLIIIIISSLAAIAGGALLPLMTVLFGNLTDMFQDYFLGLTTQKQFQAELIHYTLYFVYLGVGDYIVIYIATAGFLYTGEHITSKIREQFLAAILRQNIGFFDKLGAGEITERITSDTNVVQEGISEKVGLTLTALSTFFAAFVIAFIRFWKLTLILCSTIVAIAITMGIVGSFIVKWNKDSMAKYAEGGSLVEEVLSSVRTATAFNAQDKLARKYDDRLQEAEASGYKVKATTGVLIGFLFLYIFLNYALSFWMGSRYLVDGQMTLSQVITIQLAIIIGAFSLGNVAPSGQAMATAVGAAAKIYATIDRRPPLDPTSDVGEKLDYVKGSIELREVRHIYPSRPEVVVMDGVSLRIPAGSTCALVGASGSGKSTIVGLIERWYDSVKGDILLDGKKVKDLNVRWLRQQISLVSQEPTLFATTIFENIRHGLIGTDLETKSDAEVRFLVEDAAKMANAHEFIIALPDAYQTNVGERGFLLSGGQKQRVAIARAVISDPKVLLLDEATSALDTKSEGIVQEALYKASENRTTIVIAHRLSTIKDADNIIVMAKGRIIEQGTHRQLLNKKGSYWDLVEAQRLAAENDAKLGLTEEELIAEERERALKELNKPRPQLKRRRSSGLSFINFGRFSFGSLFTPVQEKMDYELGHVSVAESISALALADREEDSETRYSLWTLFKLVTGFNRQEWLLMVIGLAFSIICGCADPTQSVFFAKTVTAFVLPKSEYGLLQHRVDFWCWMYFMLAWVQFFARSIQGVAFAVCSERLVHRARNQGFRYMLRQDIGFFDRDENSAGALASFLSTQATSLASLSGVTLGTILAAITTLVASIIVGLAIGWKLSLVCISAVPVLLGCGYLRFWLLASFQETAKAAYERSASYACEATSAIRTVSSLTREHDVWQHYHDQLVLQGKKSLASILRSSSLYAASQSLTFLCTALGFWYGGTLISRLEYGMFQFFLVYTAIIFGSQTAGTIFSFAGDMGKAKSAAAEMKKLFDRKPAIDNWNPEGETLSRVDGHVEFRDLHFRYPTRPDVPVLRGLNLTVKRGQYIALVGPSGCGKSTCIGLIERFYDALAGGVFLDGKDITSLNIKSYRSHIALVSQEPTLYQGTIRENILLGADDDSTITDARIESACRAANIYDFIVSLPNGFNTLVGSKGSMLSGGQKQRVAIARALLRDPKVLLLDEATSALDSESEKVVQNALDAAAQGRTTIAVAHRLSTIQKADRIYVFDQGRVAEEGTHSELIAMRGRYYELVNLQNLG